MMKSNPLSLVALAAALLIAGSSARADTTPPETKTIALTPTDWSSNLVFTKFDPSLGTLTRVDFSLTGNVAGTAAFENRSAAPATITMQLKVTLSLTKPDSTVLVTTVPVANTSDTVSAYDGTLDFGGTSGKTYDNLTAALSNTSFSISGPDLSLFTGPGSITLPISATGSSSASGSGNLTTSFATSASGSATVFYTYTAVPEPSSVILTAVGGFGVMGLVRRRSARAR